MSPRFRVNTPQVINEVLDGEAVIINMGTGDYFSLRGSGAFVWEALEAGAGPAAIVGAFVAAGLGTSSEIEPGVVALVDQLEAEGLIVRVEDDGPAPAPALPHPGGAFFERPALEKFTDMQDLILLDPVHEVSERGWPHATSLT